MAVLFFASIAAVANESSSRDDGALAVIGLHLRDRVSDGFGEQFHVTNATFGDQ